MSKSRQYGGQRSKNFQEPLAGRRHRMLLLHFIPQYCALHWCYVCALHPTVLCAPLVLCMCTSSHSTVCSTGAMYVYFIPQYCVLHWCYVCVLHPTVLCAPLVLCMCAVVCVSNVLSHDNICSSCYVRHVVYVEI